jgi:hypothetical protein
VIDVEETVHVSLDLARPKGSILIELDPHIVTATTITTVLNALRRGMAFLKSYPTGLASL